MGGRFIGSRCFEVGGGSVAALVAVDFPSFLGQLTAHHRDHNHDDNPPDGSNWEWLCLYCHDPNARASSMRP